jgi:hypothetical protein
MIVWLTGVRMHIDPDSGNVETAVKQFGNVPVLFIAGGADKRMPPGVAKRLFDANQSPLKKLIVVPGAGHGEAFSTNREQYLEAVFSFFESLQLKPRTSGGP